MSEIENQSAEELLELIKDWEDPNPKPVIEKHGKVFVVRDDLLDAGTKIRAIDFDKFRKRCGGVGVRFFTRSWIWANQSCSCM